VGPVAPFNDTPGGHGAGGGAKGLSELYVVPKFVMVSAEGPESLNNWEGDPANISTTVPEMAVNGVKAGVKFEV
jgi:hypothetical protein